MLTLIQTLWSLVWVCTVCSGLSVSILGVSLVSYASYMHSRWSITFMYYGFLALLTFSTLGKNLNTWNFKVFFSSPELCSGWAIVITFRPSSVRPSVRPSVRASVRPSVRPSVNIFKRLLLWSRWANFAQISYGASLGWGNERLLKWSRSVD